ncbi:uncharacterized protein K452DRAFT_172454 [Aplosporella prunicola CBS 121167]|uniref:Uncharacterized protein n=1 Tax=Aplosporella prunicola CBS 121167 TaxID=1176127 RepID=A0A6A6AVL1_9PEZI|nr:uncharacterized protein K452DRAFT_172454 [Aplosporella prunicola CBS 121167]KAF2135626.1 hypothetical protein K452DRAFT_172454 [Aplosporella prunicola CBS 121167]
MCTYAPSPCPCLSLSLSICTHVCMHTSLQQGPGGGAGAGPGESPGARCRECPCLGVVGMRSLILFYYGGRHGCFYAAALPLSCWWCVVWWCATRAVCLKRGGLAAMVGMNGMGWAGVVGIWVLIHPPLPAPDVAHGRGSRNRRPVRMALYVHTHACTVGEITRYLYM